MIANWHSVSSILSTASKTVNLPANTRYVSVTAPSVSGYKFVCWLQPAGSGNAMVCYMDHPYEETCKMFMDGDTALQTTVLKFVVTALYAKVTSSAS